MNKKRGVSAVVTTVLVILVTISAVALVAQFVIPFVEKNLNSGTECVKYRDYFSFDESFDLNCYDGDYLFSVRAKGDESLSSNVGGFNILLKSDSEAKSYSYDEVEILTEADEEKVLADNENLIVSYFISATEGYRQAEIYPVLKNGRVCDMSDQIKIEVCSK